MADSKHTPGPWTITSISQDTGSIGVGCKAHRILIADVTNAASFGDMFVGAMRRGGGQFKQDDCHTQFANARLIAAAPELLEAVNGLFRAGQKQGWDHHYEYEMEAARAAIAKAEGRS